LIDQFGKTMATVLKRSLLKSHSGNLRSFWRYARGANEECGI